MKVGFGPVSDDVDEAVWLGMLQSGDWQLRAHRRRSIHLSKDSLLICVIGNRLPPEYPRGTACEPSMTSALFGPIDKNYVGGLAQSDG